MKLGFLAASTARKVIVGVVAVVVVAGLVVLGVTLGGSGGSPSTTAAGTGAAGPSAAAGSSAAGGSAAAGSSAAASASGTAASKGAPATAPTSGAAELPPALPAVPIGKPAAERNGMSAKVTGLDAIQGTGSGRGNISGPALRATISLTNGTPGPVDLDDVVVAMTYGADHTPAPPLDDPSRAPFHGRLAPGATATGVYVFRVPAEDRGAVTLTVGYQPGAPFLVFTGAAR